MADRNRCSAGHTAVLPAVVVWRAGAVILSLVVIGSLAGEIHAQQVPIQFRRGPRGVGQPNIDASEEQTVEGVFHGDRETRKQLKKAKQLLKDGRYSEALPLLDDILESSQDYFDSTEENKVARNGLKSEAQRLIGEQSAEGLKAYETLLGSKAERMLADALAAGDMTAVAEVARRYFHTRAGYDATLLMGRHQLDHNEPLAAALCFQRLQGTAAAEKYEPGLSVMLAVCWLRGGMEPRARQVMMDLKKRDPQATIRIAGREVKIFSATDEVHAMAWLVENFGQQQAGGAIEAANWAVVGGNPARNAASAGGMPLMNFRSETPVVPTQEAIKTAVSARQEGLDRNLPTIPVMQPLAVADCVLMRAPSGLLTEVDFNSGKRIWDNHAHFPEGLDRGSNAAGVRGNGMFFNGQDPFYIDRLWENATYATLSSDGEYVFEVEELPDNAPIRELPRRAAFLRQNGMIGGSDNQRNELAAYELRTQGKIKWRVGGDKQDIEIEPALTGAFFLGPPLPLLGRLYVLADIKGEIRLVVLDAKTGKMDWSQQLASPEDANGMGNGFLRTTGISPSYADGILICPTSAGAVVAVDIANRALLWGYEYPHGQQVPQQPMMAVRRGLVVNAYGMQNFMGDRWSDATATVADGCVLLTPVESDQLFCLSLLDGKLLWKMDRSESIYFGGVHDGKVLVVGRKQVQAFQLTSGKPAWPNPLLLPQGSMPSGRGFLSESHYFLPLSSAEVASIDLDGGTIVARAKSRKGIVPGNLICYKGSVISLGVDHLYLFYQLGPLKERIATRLAENPDSAEALAGRGNIELDEGKIPEAIANIRKSYEKSPIPGTRELLVEALLADLRRDFSSSRATVGELEKLIVLDGERTSFLRMLAEGLGKIGDRQGALDAYLKLIDLPWGQGEPEVVSNVLSVRRDRWLRARVDQLYAAATTEERAKFDAAVSDRLNQALAAKQPRDLRRFLGYFGFHPAADEAREQLAAQLSGQENLIERELLLNELERSTDPVRRRAAVARTAELLSSPEVGKYDEAAIYYHRLEHEFADVVCMSGKTGKQLVEGLPADSPAKKALAQTAWPEGIVRREPAEFRGRPQNMPRPFPISWRGTRPSFLETVTVAFDQQQQVVGHDGFGRERFRVAINDSGQNRLGFQPISPDLNFAQAQGHLLVVNLGNQVLALDTLRQQGGSTRVLWQQDLIELAPNVFNGQPIPPKEIRLPWGAVRHVPAAENGNNGQSLGIVGPLVNRCILVGRSRELTAFDPVTGEILWSRRGIEPGSEVFGDDDVLIVAPPDGLKDTDSVTASVFRTMDGEELGTRKIPKADHRWAYCGRRCLSGRTESDGKLTFVLGDPWKEKDVVLGTFDSGVKPTLVGDESAAFLEPNGRFLMIALDDGHKTINAQLEPEKELDNIVIQRTPDQYLLFANRPSAQARSVNQPMPQGMLTPDGIALINGHIYAFERESGKPLWPVPALVENHYAVLNQGIDLPAIVLMKWRQPNRMAASAENKSSILCLDRRTGRAVLEQELNQQLNVNAMNCDLSGDRDRKTITLTMPSQSLMLRFTTDPIPPEPPYQAGLLTKQSQFGSNPAGAALRAIFPGSHDSGGSRDGDPFNDGN